MTAPTIPAPRSELAPLNLAAVEQRLSRLSLLAAWQLLVMLLRHIDEHGVPDHATFLRLADEAEASVKP